MSDPFADSRLKVDRAKKHITDLENLLESFINRNPYTTEVIDDPNSAGDRLLVLRVREELPKDVSCYIGDASHNLRASLDILACTLVRLNGKSTASVMFPFARDANTLEERIRLTHINKADPEIVNMIRSLKPYTGGNDLLRGLHDLDIADKHSALTPTISMARSPNFKVGGMRWTGSHFGPIKDGLKLQKIPAEAYFEIDNDFHPAIAVFFEQGQPFETEAVMPTLHQITQLVDGIVGTFAAYFSKT